MIKSIGGGSKDPEKKDSKFIHLDKNSWHIHH